MLPTVNHRSQEHKQARGLRPLENPWQPSCGCESALRHQRCRRTLSHPQDEGLSAMFFSSLIQSKVSRVLVNDSLVYCSSTPLCATSEEIVHIANEVGSQSLRKSFEFQNDENIQKSIAHFPIQFAPKQQ